MLLDWLLLFIAISFEVAGTTAMKLSRGFSKLIPTLFMFGLYGIGLGLMNLVIKRMEISIVYAVWSGVGTVMVALIGIFLFTESATTIKLVSIFLIIIGVVGLNLSGTH